MKPNLSNDDLATLEALVKSPAYTVLKKVMGSVVEESQSILLTEKDPVAIYRHQGRAAAGSILNNLGSFVQTQKEHREKREQLQQARADRDNQAKVRAKMKNKVDNAGRKG